MSNYLLPHLLPIFFQIIFVVMYSFVLGAIYFQLKHDVNGLNDKCVYGEVQCKCSYMHVCTHVHTCMDIHDHAQS